MSPVYHCFTHCLPLLPIFYLIIYLSSVSSSPEAIYPCPSTEPIRWIRDPKDCHTYFICSFGQPIIMPKCPNTQVWSNSALNCVPKSSSWNDCPKSSLPPDDKLTNKITATTHHPSMITISQRSTHSNIPSSTSEMQKKSSSSTVPKIDHPCSGRTGILPHPTQCHWYYNCSLDAEQPEWKKHEPFTVECPYPQLFDEFQMRCREYLNVKCGPRFEPVAHCEYREEQCNNVHCIPCEERFSSCRKKADGIYPFRTEVWSPIFVSCYDQRNIAQDKCFEPTPIFSPEEHNCVSIFDVPKEKGGLKPNCLFHNDGLHADEQGRCSVYFECKNERFIGYFECNQGFVFDPITRNCVFPHMAPPPCGENQQLPTCRHREDGFYADEYSRCPYYFECRNFKFQKYHRCNFGSFDAQQQQCIIPIALMIRPCGLQPNPCNNKLDGTYAADTSLSNQCNAFIECSHGLLIHNGTCKNKKIFNKSNGRCEHPDNDLRPCNQQNLCANRKNGQYPAPQKGCSYYFECLWGQFQGYKKCNFQMGGEVFNPDSRKCDGWQNVCPPCGYKWYGCYSMDSF